MPQPSPNLAPRPEFIPFSVPYLCISEPCDGKDFWTYPERCGWNINVQDQQCHVFCPPGYCKHGIGPADVVLPSILSRSDGTPVLASDKVAFLQAWLFFGALNEVSSLCGLEIDIAAEFIVDGQSISTENLNGLPGRWFEAAIRARRAGDRDLMSRILTVARHLTLMLSSEILDREDVHLPAEVFMNDIDYVHT
ncbi:hypothetical protein VKT23_014263 [Stygiomarasmius scandens]|uniref:Uncharacterized protein n=1 Tax=Marasmiellus scandens TaxID=2682957 RepID=A0ABR1J1A6_9AGAR